MKARQIPADRQANIRKERVLKKRYSFGAPAWPDAQENSAPNTEGANLALFLINSRAQKCRDGNFPSRLTHPAIDGELPNEDPICAPTPSEKGRPSCDPSHDCSRFLT